MNNPNQKYFTSVQNSSGLAADIKDAHYPHVTRIDDTGAYVYSTDITTYVNSDYSQLRYANVGDVVYCDGENNVYRCDPLNREIFEAQENFTKVGVVVAKNHSLKPGKIVIMSTNMGTSLPYYTNADLKTAIQNSELNKTIGELTLSGQEATSLLKQLWQTAGSPVAQGRAHTISMVTEYSVGPFTAGQWYMPTQKELQIFEQLKDRDFFIKCGITPTAGYLHSSTFEYGVFDNESGFSNQWKNTLLLFHTQFGTGYYGSMRIWEGNWSIIEHKYTLQKYYSTISPIDWGARGETFAFVDYTIPS